MRRLAGCLAALAVLLSCPAVAGARSQQTAADAPKAWILVDADSGAVLTGGNIHAPQLPASTVKIMTALTAAEILPSDARLTVSATAATREPMRIDMREGESWPFSDALRSMLLVSANDAAYAIAENAGGSLDGFAARMTNAAQRMGMKDSTFSDPAGLDSTTAMAQPNAVSAYDLAIAARNVLSVPELADIVATKKATFVDPRGSRRSLTNHNGLLNTFPGATGTKTGWTKQAGRTLVASATRDGRTMIAAVFSVQDHYGWVSRLMDQGFATPRNASGSGERIPSPVIIPQSVRSTIPGGSIPRPVIAPPTTSARPAVPVSSVTNDRTRKVTSTGLDLVPGSSWTYIGGTVVVIGGSAFVWRRRAIKRRRRARLERQHRVDLARARAARSAIEFGLPQKRGVRS
ncbi:MAG: D-alanyl-D-alanine carboxypeptidase family protein [Acidimicrobiia bacterium]